MKDFCLLHKNEIIADLTDPEEDLWLKSLIWPEHGERRNNFEKASHCFKEQSVELIEGDGVRLLPNLALNIPLESTLCIFHTHVANQIPKDDKHKLMEHIQELGKVRDVFHLYDNMWDLNLHLDYYLGGEEYTKTIAETDGHGRWFQWKA